MRGSVSVIAQMIRKEFAQIRRDRRMLVVSLLAPVLQVLLLGYAATTDIRNSAVVVCDLDHTAESRDFVRRFTSTRYFLHGGSARDLGEVDAFLDDARASLALVIPRGFARDMLARRTPEVQILLDGTDANTAALLMAYAAQVSGAYAEELLREALPGSARAGRIIPQPRIWFNPDLRSSHFMVPGVVALVLLIITMTLTSLAIVKEKEKGTLEQLMVTPLRPLELILGKLIPFVAIGAADTLIVLGLARFWFDVPLVGSLWILALLSGVFILTTLGLGLFISTIARSQQQAMLIAQFFFFMPFLFLSGFTFPIANMPPLIQWLTYAIPLRYYLEIVRGIFLKGSGLAELWPQALALFGLGSCIFLLSVKRFRKRLS
ncbi:MAG: ABC transporter permease [Bacteroidota bacterium]